MLEVMRILTVIDCGPSRLCIWRKVANESAKCLVETLREILYERGFVEEVVMDNAKSFRSQLMKELCDEWGMKIMYRCANEPKGNGIAERNHRTIKRMVARTQRQVSEMVYWYNSSPRESQHEKSVPFAEIYAYYGDRGDVLREVSNRW